MSDEQLTQQVEKAKGRVFIGFKNPGAAGGVDEMGRVLATAVIVAEAKASLRSMGVEFEYESRDMPYIGGTIPVALAATLRKLAWIDYVEPIFPGSYLAQDTTWNIRKINSPTAWAYTTGTYNTGVMILDSGHDYSNPDLSYRNTASCTNTWGDDQLGHGTFVAGIVGAVNNSDYIIGAAHGVGLWSTQIGVTNPDPMAVACGVSFARGNANVFAINMSFNILAYTPVTDEINTAYNINGKVLVGAAGNNASVIKYPATLANVIAVGAVDSVNVKSYFSNTGSKLEIVAPGSAVVSTSLASGSVCTTGGYTATCDGTSFAAPHVAAAAAMVKSTHPTWSNATVRARLTSTATDLGTAGKDNSYGWGLLNMGLAVQ